MEIDFNLSRVPKPEVRQPLTRQGAVPAASNMPSTRPASPLVTQLNDISLVRAEKVDYGKVVAPSESYPPVELLDRIANLLAVHLVN